VDEGEWKNDKREKLYSSYGTMDNDDENDNRSPRQKFLKGLEKCLICFLFCYFLLYFDFDFYLT
jgi:hypothetical protein